MTRFVPTCREHLEEMLTRLTRGDELDPGRPGRGGVRRGTQRRTARHSVTPAGVRAVPLMVDPATRPV